MSCAESQWGKRKKDSNADAVVHCACTGKERKKAHASGKITEEICGNSVFLQLQELYLKSGFMPPLTDEVKKVFSGERDFSEVFFAMVRDGVLVRFDEKHYMHWEIRQKALDMAYLLYEEKGMIQTGEFRDRLGISRKCAIILLERFDRERITVMENGGRVLKTKLAAGRPASMRRVRMESWVCFFGGNIWESNPSGTGLAPHTGLKTRRHTGTYLLPVRV